MPARWAERSETLRDTLSHERRAMLNVSYGSHERACYDLFLPQGSPQGTVVFIHGGYWHLFDKSYWSHLAQGCLAHGWSVAMPSYPLAPEVKISDITHAIRAAVLHIADQSTGPLVLTGHSAGGHLAARMVCKGMLPASIVARLQRVMPISGLHQLLPLTATKLNDTLGLTPNEAKVESPISYPPEDTPVTFWVGANERPEFLRQNRIGAEVWDSKGGNITSVYAPDRHHFDVIEPLADPDSAMVQALLRP